jgi:hypothetical protein
MASLIFLVTATINWLAILATIVFACLLSLVALSYVLVSLRRDRAKPRILRALRLATWDRRDRAWRRSIGIRHSHLNLQDHRDRVSVCSPHLQTASTTTCPQHQHVEHRSKSSGGCVDVVKLHPELLAELMRN